LQKEHATACAILLTL